MSTTPSMSTRPCGWAGGGGVGGDGWQREGLAAASWPATSHASSETDRGHPSSPPSLPRPQSPSAPAGARLTLTLKGPVTRVPPVNSVSPCTTVRPLTALWPTTPSALRPGAPWTCSAVAARERVEGRRMGERAGAEGRWPGQPDAESACRRPAVMSGRPSRRRSRPSKQQPLVRQPTVSAKSPGAVSLPVMTTLPSKACGRYRGRRPVGQRPAGSGLAGAACARVVWAAVGGHPLASAQGARVPSSSSSAAGNSSSPTSCSQRRSPQSPTPGPPSWCPAAR